MFTEASLRKMATSQSFQRGHSYFQSGSVRKLKQVNTREFTARVHGSEVYNVTLTLDQQGNLEDCACDCMYNFEGICKHCVATGLAVLDKLGNNLKSFSTEEDVIVSEIIGISFSEAFAQTSTETKLTFLQQVLTRNPDLQQSFIQFSGILPPQKSAISTEKNAIETLSTEIYEILSDLSFDTDTLIGYTGEEGYYDEGDLFESAADEMVTEVLESYAQKVGTLIQKGKLLEGMHQWLGVYEGIRAAVEPAEEEYSLWPEDYPSFCLEIWHKLLTQHHAYTYINQHPQSEMVCRQVIDLLLERYQTLQNMEEEEEIDPNEEWQSIGYNLSDFKELLLGLTQEKSTAQYLKQQLEEKQLVNIGTVEVLLQLCLMLENRTDWVSLSETFAPYNAQIAEDLLHYYQTTNQKELFIAAARKNFDAHPSELDTYVIQYLTYEESQLLVLSALKHYCMRTLSLPTYQTLRSHLNSTERQGFIAQHRNHLLFYVQMLEIEESYAAIVSHIQSKTEWLYEREMPQAIAIAAKYEPEELLKMVTQRIERCLAPGKQNRSVYAQLAKWLEALAKNQTLQASAKETARQLVTTYNRLSALRDELHMHGLIRK